MRGAVFLFAALLAGAHPMGNFSVNQYTLIRPGVARVQVVYVVDLAESPAYDLLRRATSRGERRAWIGWLRFPSAGQPVRPRIDSIDPASTAGAGGLATLRITAPTSLSAPPTTHHFS